ncbi:MAG TPA: FIST N-terminal domain-containing protein [Acidimicrobiales bacterium]|nr:FIST N-terminal domain-containing protein [Acidimicrobiales bacterium]
MTFAAALSQHPLATHAVGEVVGEVLDGVGEAPDLALLFVSTAHTGAVDDIAGAVRDLLRPSTLLGCTTATVVGGGREVEQGPAIALWAGASVAATPFRLQAEVSPDGAAVSGFPERADLPDDASGVLLLGDPFTFPAHEFVEGLRDQTGLDLPVVGGLASAARGPGGSRLLLDGGIVDDGAVGVVLSGVELSTVVSQGCRPIGSPMAVTRSERQVIYELAGRPALERVQEIVAGLGPEDLAMAQHGLHLGRVIDEQQADYGRGDFLIRNVIGGDRDAGAIAVGDEVQVGATVQLQVRDADSADEDLRRMLHGRAADAALLFTCAGRGSNLFGEPDHDARTVDEILGPLAMAGMSCAGEIGPVGGRSFLHGLTASLLMLSDPAGPA